MIAPLEELQQTYPDADIFLNGELTVDFPEDVKIPIEPNQMTTASLSGSNIKCALLWVGESDRSFKRAVCGRYVRNKDSLVR